MLKKRIPTILGLILLIGGAVAGVVFVGQETDFLPRANPAHTPTPPKITNITENSFVVSWTTPEPIHGYLKLGSSPSSLTTVIQDDRNQLSGQSTPYRTHYISVRELEPQTTYYFKIYSDKQAYDNNGRPYSLQTAAVLSVPPPSDTIYGTVLTPAETPADGAIVYATLPDASPLSALVKKDGNYALSLSIARSLGLKDYAQYDPQKARLDLRIETGKDADLARATTVTGNISPVPTITLGQTFDFSSQTTSQEPGTAAEQETVDQALAKAQSKTNPTPLPQSRFSVSDFDQTTTTASESGLITLETIDNRQLSDNPLSPTAVSETKPVIAGKAPSESTIVIEVHSDQVFTQTVDADSTGSWTWTPPADLEPGPHTVTITYLDDDGQEHTISRNFVVASSTQTLDTLSYTATPSAAPTPSPSPVSTSSASPTPALRSSLPSTSSGVPTAGSTSTTYTLLFLGLLLVSAGIAFLPKPQKE